MDTNDRKAIQDLFGKLSHVEQQAPQRDAEAESFIRQEIDRHPGAPYYMAQTIIVQEQALEAAQRRIEELEAKAQTRPQEGGGGLFGGLFGGGDRTPPRRPAGSVPRVGGGGAPTPGNKWGAAGEAAQASSARQGMGGGGFLAGAAQTAMGVAGGVLLGNAIAGMFAGDEAQAAEAAPEQEVAPEAENASFDEGGFEDDNFDMGGFDDI